MAGCTDDGEVTGPRPTDGVTATPAPTGTPDQPTPTPGSPSPTASTPGPPFPADTEPDTAEGSGEEVVVTDIEVARNDGFDRVVLSIGEDGLPGWLVEFVDEARAQGSGEEVEVAGDATLQVTLRNMALPPESDTEAYDGPHRIDPDDTEVIEEVVYGTTFEGQTQLWVGLSQRRPFRAQLFEDPTRVVIDVVHPDRG